MKPISQTVRLQNYKAIHSLIIDNALTTQWRISILIAHSFVDQKVKQHN